VRVLIVDDEPPARARLTGLVAEIAGAEVAGEAGTGREALDRVQRLAPELVLLDVRMPGMDGLEVARHLATLDAPPAVIFTTAYDQHALSAFEANAVDYLLKPIRRERLEAALARAGRLSRAQLASLAASPAAAGEARTHLSATTGGNLEIVPVAEVRYFQAGDKYVTVRSAERGILVEDPLKSLEDEFGDTFLRVHRNALVALAHVTGLERSASGALRVRLDGVEETLAVSRRLAARVRRALRARG